MNPSPRSSTSARLAKFAAAAAAALATASMALAQAGTTGELQPPIPSPPLNAPSHPMGMAIAIALLALVIAANLIPSKRGHQD